jgi:hypothetical protein
MAVPSLTHPGWIKAISGQGAQNVESLATKLLLGRLSQSYKRDPSPANIKKCAAELQEFFERNQTMPKFQGDLKKIIEGR